MTRRPVAWHLLPPALALAAALAAGCTAPRSFHFDVAADMRDFTPPAHPGPDYFAGACQAIQRLGPGAFMLIPGDLDPPDRVFATLAAELGPDYVAYPVVGNHELDDPATMPWLRACNAGGKRLPAIVRTGPPGALETCYAFDYGDAHFVVLNQYYDGRSDSVPGGDISDALCDWLATDLAASSRPYIFVVGHEPVLAAPDLTNGRVRHQGDSLDEHSERAHRFWTLLRKHGVVAYICGHSHNASVTKLNGVWQLDTGHARGRGDPGAPSTFLQIFVAPSNIRCRVYRADEDPAHYRLVFEEQLR